MPSLAEIPSTPDEPPAPGEARRLLGDTLPDVVDACASASRAYDNGQLSELDMLVHESKLRDLIGEVVSVHAGDPEPTGFRTHAFDLRETGEPHGYMAHAPMSFCPESALIVHAPIMLGRLCAIVARIVGETDRPTGFRDVRLRRPVRHNLRFILDAGGRAGLEPGEERPSIDGVVLTDRGRELHFRGYEVAGEPVTAWIDNAGLDESFVVGPQGGGALKASISGWASPHIGSPADAVQFLLEAMIRAIVVTRGVDGRGLLLAGIKSLRWPVDLEARMRRGLDFLVQPHPASTPPPQGRWQKLPVSYSVDADPGGMEAEFFFVEGRVRLGSIFA